MVAIRKREIGDNNTPKNKLINIILDGKYGKGQGEAIRKHSSYCLLDGDIYGEINPALDETLIEFIEHFLPEPRKTLFNKESTKRREGRVYSREEIAQKMVNLGYFKEPKEAIKYIPTLSGIKAASRIRGGFEFVAERHEGEEIGYKARGGVRMCSTFS